MSLTTVISAALLVVDLLQKGSEYLALAQGLAAVVDKARAEKRSLTAEEMAPYKEALDDAIAELEGS
jgi:hypothetical protein